MPDLIDRFIQMVPWKQGNFSFLPIFFGTLLALLDIGMMGLSKMVSIGQVSWNIGVPTAMAIYSLEPLIFIRALKYEGMVVTNLVWNLVSDIIVTLQGILIFGEKIKNLRWVAIGMSLVALAIFAYTDSD
jgi:multidrug transporter EmrE-like cation transporter